jgi:sugar/nucleoside kinase (ribokinase family)
MVTLDYLYAVDSYPAEGTTRSAASHRVVAGGPVGRGAITAARLGARVRLLAMCGDDLHAEALRQEIAREPIEVTFFACAAPSQHSCVLAATDRASRTIIWTPQPPADERILHALEKTLAGVDAVLLDCTDATLGGAVSRLCREHGIPSVIDTGSYRESCEDYLCNVDHIIAPAKFFQSRNRGHALLDAMEKVHVDFTPASLVATQGENGGLYRDATGTHAYPAYPVSTVDSSGAGDTFHGAFTWALAAGVPMDAAIRIASWAAAQKCAAVGNDSLPTAHSLSTMLPELISNQSSF